MDEKAGSGFTLKTRLTDSSLVGRQRHLFALRPSMFVGGIAESAKIQKKTRPDTQLPKSRAGGQGPYLRSSDHLGSSSEVKEIKS